MIDMVAIWSVIIVSFIVSVYSVVTISRVKKSVSKLETNLNERHSAWQVLWAKEYKKLSDRVNNLAK